MAVLRTAKGLWPFTWTSMAFFVLLYFVWFFEVGRHANQILYAVAVFLCLAWGLLFAFTLVCSFVVYGVTRSHNRQATADAEPVRNEVGGHIKSNYQIFCPFFLPFVTVETVLREKSFARHSRRKSIWESEWLEPTGRGRFGSLHRVITVADIFGLTSITFTMRQDVHLEVMPAMSGFEFHALQTRAAGDAVPNPDGSPLGEMIEMRRYQAGDPLRLVLWKVFARSRKLVVRAPEPAVVEQSEMFVYFVSGHDDESSASMARAFLSTFAKVVPSTGAVEEQTLSFSADGAGRISRTRDDGMDDVIDSVGHRDRAGMDLMTVAPMVSRGSVENCFLLVPGTPGPWLSAIREFVTRYGVRPTFIISVDGNSLPGDDSEHAGLLGRIFMSRGRDRKAKSGVDGVCAALADMGTVRVADVATGAVREYGGGV